MKMTMHIDEELLDRVVKRFGCASKTEAVEMALKEMDRKARFRDLVKTGLGLTPEELKKRRGSRLRHPRHACGRRTAGLRRQKIRESQKMNAPVLVDSNVYIGLLRRGLDPAEILGAWIGSGDLATCGMVRLEVERGLKIEKIRRRVSALFDVLINVPTTNKIWEAATAEAWTLDRQGITLPAQDILIASCAREIGAAVLTDDKHFEEFHDLPVLKPADEFPEW